MQATPFYQTESSDIIPLEWLTEAEWSTQTGTFTANEQNHFIAQQFKGAIGDICILSNKDGKPNAIYLGAGDGRCYPTALAAAVLKLPKGSYQFVKPITQQTVLMWSLAQYRFDQYKACKQPARILVVTPTELTPVRVAAEAIFLVRDLINKPANELNPQQLAETVQLLSKKYNAVFEQWVGEELIHNNFPAIFTVGCASCFEPRLLSLTWGDEQHPRVTLVGKGVCFDSGGLDIKPSSGMRIMKKDMGGAAMVIGLAQWLMECQLPIRLQVLIPAVENAIGSRSYRPGDVLTMRNKLTVEIGNTDAEGRLVLADALVKACEENPELLIDFATLTGAARVAIGTEIAPMWTNDDTLAEGLLSAGERVGDPIWRMPLFPGYEDMIQSPIADLSNSGVLPYAGAITAALFLQHFIKKEISWAHFDTMAWNIVNKPGRPEGGEAMAVKAVAEYLINRYRN